MKNTPNVCRLPGVLALALLLTACGPDTAVDAVGTAGTDTVTPAEVVVPGNNAPVLTGQPGTAVDAGVDYVFQPSASDADNDTLTFSAQGLPAWAALDSATGRISGRPAATDEGETADITLQVNDGKQTVELKSFKIAIRRTDQATSVAGTQPPVISGAPTLTLTANSSWSFTPVASDPDTLKLTFSIVNKPTWASFSTATGALTGTPATRNVGAYANIIIGVSDGVSSAVLPAFRLQVLPAPNSAPTISGTPSGSATVGSAYSFTPKASDPDGQTLGFSITNKPSWANFNTVTGALTGVPGAGNVGSFNNIAIQASDGKLQAALPSFSITVAAAANGAPTISGTPATAVTAGSSYSFLPVAADPNGDALTFTISGKPIWATFDTATGRLTGTPSAGSFANVSISVTDGKSTTSLPAFNILVSQPTVGSASLSWTPPTQNTDGSSLTNLGGYRIYYGNTTQAMTQSIQITNPGLTSYTVGNLTPGTYFFSLAAYTTDGVESAPSAVGSKTIL